MAFNLHNKFRYYCSVQFSCSVMSDSLWPHGLQHTRLPSITNSWSFQWIFRTNLLYDCLLWSPCSPRNSQESSPTPHFKSINSLVFSFLSEKAVPPHSSSLVWKIPWMEEPGRLQSMGSLRDRHDWMTSLSLFTFMHWRRKWQPTPVFLPGEYQGWGSLVGCRLRGHTESDMSEVT